MRILLIAPPCIYSGEYHNYMPPLGLLSIATCVRQQEIEVKVIDCKDPETTEAIEKIVDDYEPTIVGLSVMTTNYPEAVKISQLLKRKGIKIVYGGPHPSADWKGPLMRNYADVCVTGPGEDAFMRVIKGEDLDGIPGVAYKRGNELRYYPHIKSVNISLLPTPERTFLNLREYFTYIDSPVHGKVEANTLYTSMGCVHNCIYCIARNTCNWTRRLPEQVCDEIGYLNDINPKEGLFFCDLTFTVDKKWIYQFCGQMVKRGLNRYKWYVMGNVDLVDEGLLESMAEAGCIQVSYGFEVLDDRILRNIGKKQTVKEIERVVKMTSNAGLCPMAHFIVGLPGQTRETLFRELEVIKEWIVQYHFYPGDFYPMMIFPGTEIFRRGAHKYGGHDWLSEISGNFVFKNIPVYEEEMALDELLEISDYMNMECRRILKENTKIYNKTVKSRKSHGTSENES